MVEKSGFVYLWRDRKNNRYYVGCHWGFENDGYICSSPWMRQAYLHRPTDFKRKILKRNISNRELLFIEELRWLKMIKPKEIKIRYYNLNITNNETWHKYEEKRLTIGQRISASKKGKKAGPCSPEKALNISAAKLRNNDIKRAAGIPIYSDETRRKHSENRLGTILPESQKQKIGSSLKKHYETHDSVHLGSKHTDEHKKAIGDAHRGMKRTDETKANIAAGNSKDYTIVFLDGTKLLVHGLKKYAKDNQIPYISLHKAYLHNSSLKKHQISAVI